MGPRQAHTCPPTPKALKRSTRQQRGSFWLETENSGGRTPFFPPPNCKIVPSSLPERVCSIWRKVNLVGFGEPCPAEPPAFVHVAHVPVCTAACFQCLCSRCSKSISLQRLLRSWLLPLSLQSPPVFRPPSASKRGHDDVHPDSLVWGDLELPDLPLGIMTLGHPSCFPSPPHLRLFSLPFFIHSFAFQSASIY